jgi:hypothetical protein
VARSSSNSQWPPSKIDRGAPLLLSSGADNPNSRALVGPFPTRALLALVAATAAFSIAADNVNAQNLSMPEANVVLRGKAAYGDWRSDVPGIRRHIMASALPDPYSSPSTANSVVVVQKPAEGRLRVPPGFEVKLFASGLDQPRLIRVAPNGDIFVVESSASQDPWFRSQWRSSVRRRNPSGRQGPGPVGVNVSYSLDFLQLRRDVFDYSAPLNVGKRFSAPTL